MSAPGSSKVGKIRVRTGSRVEFVTGAKDRTMWHNVL